MNKAASKTVFLLLIITLMLFTISRGQSRDEESGTFTDSRDNNTYSWVKIGNQIWMAENLRYKTDNGSWCWDNDEDECLARGRLYDWQAAMDAAPPGWHIPSDGEWKELELSLGLSPAQVDSEGMRVDSAHLAAGKIKSKDSWPAKYNGSPITVTNETGFTAIKTGFYAINEFTHEGYTGWWSNTDDGSMAWIRHIGFFDNSIGRVLNKKEFAYPVRCVKDSE